MQQRIRLSADLAPQTTAYVRFEKTGAELNHFYWTFKCALDYIVPALNDVNMVQDLVPGRSGEKLNIPAAEFVAERPETERVARHSMLVLYVTAFEDYVKEVLTTFLVRNWKLEKTNRISFRPEELPSQADIQDWLRARAIEAIVDDYLGRRYDTRFDAVSKLVAEHGARKPTLSQDAKTLAAQACEARNNIVHASGVADARTVTALQSVIPAIGVGGPLNVTEELLWKFLGALRDSARALDVELRSLPQVATG